MKTKVIYVSGLGDSYDGFRKFGMKIWRLFGADAELVPMNWNDGNSLSSKLRKIERAVNRAAEENRSVVVVGESAGASIALIAASKFKQIRKVVTLCGVAQASTPIAKQLRARAPALDEAVKALNDLSMPRTTEVVSVKAVYDLTVNTPYSIADNAQVMTLWSFGHLMTIAAALTFYAPYLIRISR